MSYLLGSLLLVSACALVSAQNMTANMTASGYNITLESGSGSGSGGMRSRPSRCACTIMKL